MRIMRGSTSLRILRRTELGSLNSVTEVTRRVDFGALERKVRRAKASIWTLRHREGDALAFARSHGPKSVDWVWSVQNERRGCR